MSFAENSLIAGEQIVYEGKLHWSVMLGPVIGGIFFGLPGLMLLVGSAGAGLMSLTIAFIFIAYGMLKMKLTEMAITDKRILLKKGILGSRTIEVFLSKVEAITVDEPLLGKMLGYGTIVIRGTGGTQEPFAKVANPLEFKKRVQMIIDSHNMAASAK
jgi:uncharacterized membrane protein YdbT with pleckstrin-like domain